MKREKIIRNPKDEVIRVVRDPSIELDKIKKAFEELPEEDRERMPYVVELIAQES